jgi:hypothetical protein
MGNLDSLCDWGWAPILWDSSGIRESGRRADTCALVV